jgi:hypothetical protein
LRLIARLFAGIQVPRGYVISKKSREEGGFKWPSLLPCFYENSP